MDALKRDLRVLLIGVVVLALLVFVIGLFHIILLGVILLAGYFLLALNRSKKQDKKEDPKTT